MRIEELALGFISGEIQYEYNMYWKKLDLGEVTNGHSVMPQNIKALKRKIKFLKNNLFFLNDFITFH